MSLIGNFLLGILTMYIAVTSSMAEYIENLLSLETATPQAPAEVNETLERLPTESLSIPDILIKNAAFQGAAVIDSEARWQATAKDAGEAIVNIFCTFTTDDYIRSTTGTGFFIHSDGVVLTNAHVAQFLLLETANPAGEAECVARTGSPAVPTYKLSLLYIPPAWIQTHAGLIDQMKPSGTGERDYALLYVSSGFNNSPMPRVFPSLAPDLSPLALENRGDSVTVAGYPAKDFAESGPSALLIPVVAETTISELYTFSFDKADVVAVKGSAIGEQGSSGGPILNQNGEVIGLISTRGNDEHDGVGSLRGISLEYINRTITEETGFSLERNVTGDLPYRAQIFSETLAPFLTAILIREIDS